MNEQQLTIEQTLNMRHCGEISDFIILDNILKTEIRVHSFIGQQKADSMGIPPLATQINETVHLSLDIPVHH